MADFSKKEHGGLAKENVMMISAGVFLILVAIFLVFENVKLYKKQAELATTVSSSSDQIQKMQAENQSLQEKIANYDNPDYIEKVAREEENMKKPGEQVVSFIMPDEKAAVSAQSTWSIASFKDVLNSIWGAIKSIF